MTTFAVPVCACRRGKTDHLLDLWVDPKKVQMEMTSIDDKGINKKENRDEIEKKRIKKQDLDQIGISRQSSLSASDYNLRDLFDSTRVSRVSSISLSGNNLRQSSLSASDYHLRDLFDSTRVSRASSISLSGNNLNNTLKPNLSPNPTSNNILSPNISPYPMSINLNHTLPSLSENNHHAMHFYEAPHKSDIVKITNKGIIELSRLKKTFPTPLFPRIPRKAPGSLKNLELRHAVTKCLKAFMRMAEEAFQVIKHVASLNPDFLAEQDEFGIAPGTHIYVVGAYRLPGITVYTHHGIYIGACRVVDVGTIPKLCDPKARSGLAAFHQISWDFKAQGIGLNTLDNFTKKTLGKFHVFAYPAKYQIRSTVQILFDSVNSIGPKPYDLFRDNCEHFSTYMVTSIYESSQVEWLKSWTSKFLPSGFTIPRNLLKSSFLRPFGFMG
jgi:hypothetical protein